MSHGWDNVEPAPIEYFHGRIMDRFHEYRLKHTTDINVALNGQDLATIIALAKGDTYKKYPKQNLQRNIPKTEM